MENFHLPSFCIKSKWALPVKLTGLFTLIALTFTPATLNASNPDTNYDPLPEIEARTFEVTHILQSRTGRVILLESARAELLTEGRLLLLKLNSAPVVAVRVLKIYPHQSAFAAKGLHYYGSNRKIAHLDKFQAVEKISDILPQSLSLNDLSDLKEVEDLKEAKDLKDLGDLKELGSLEPLDDNDSEYAKLGQSYESEIKNLVIDEIPHFDRYRNWLTAGIGYLQNSDHYFAAGGLRYGLTLFNRPFFERSHIQDSLALEGGIYGYKALNFASLSDSYFIMNTISTVRYNLLFSDSFGIFLYGGTFRNIASSTSEQSTAEVAQELSGQGVAAGLGMMFSIGPNWNARLDLGTDIAGLGLVLRF